MKDGIYFNMPEEQYHSLPYLSRSTMEDVLVDVEEAWHNSALNPERPANNPTEAMNLGSAIHSAILEPEVFEELYCRAPKPDDFDGRTILNTNEELGNFLVSVGEKKTGKKEELIARAAPYLNPDQYVIWDVVQKNFAMDVAEHGKRILAPESFEVIQGIRDSMERRPKLKEIYSKGYPEVTIIWTDEETGVKCKCRMDYVRPEAIGELKSFSLKGKKQIYKAVCDEIVWNKYNLQFAVYSHALATIIKKIRMNEAEVFGDVDQEWLEEFLKSPRKQFFILFVRTAAPYQVMAVEMAKNFNEGTDNVYYSESMFAMRTATKLFKQMQDKFGEKRWINEDCVRELDDIHVPGVQYQNIL